MSRFHENSIKWLNEQIKKKCKTKTSNVEEDLKQCIYCPKIFKNSAFVIKHIFRRHAEQFLRHHKIFLDTTDNELGLDPEAVLINYLKSEFSNIKSELEIVKKSVTHHSQVGDNTKNQVICSTGYQECSGSDANALENEPSLINSKHFIPKEDFKKLQEKVEDMSQKYKEVASSNKEMAYLLEDRICKRLKKELIEDFKNLLIQTRDSEWKPHVSQLKKDLNKLEQLVKMNAGKIDSPEVQQEVRKKIDEQVQSFFENYGIVEERSRTSSKSSRRGLSDGPLNMNAHRVNRRAKSIYTSRSQDPNLASTHLETPVKTCYPQFRANDPKANISGSEGSSTSRHNTSIKLKDPQMQANVSETNNVQPSSILKGIPESIQKIGARKAKVLFVEKLKDFGLSRETKQLSAEEYERKSHLVNAENKVLCQKYKNFRELYARLDSHADELIKSHMERKFRKQLRFSDSISFQASGSKDQVVHDQELEKTSPPFERVISPFMNQSEFMQDLGAIGDFSNDEDFERPFSNCARNMAKTNCESKEKVTSPFMNQSEFMQDLGENVDGVEENCKKSNSNYAAETNSKSKGKQVIEPKNKTLLVNEVTSPSIDQDLGACGDFNAEEEFDKPNSKLARNIKGEFASNKLASKKAALSQNLASNTSISEPPGKVLYPGPHNDHLDPIEEFSELSSLESDTDLFLNEFDQI
ncbi:hypothetical protein JTE90_016665 [Oedothorax gibbosus]|uniref:C2H2-type domain-containing protein n=1 Tax=Oedothorax gibbosus TaxID=931172 RepID=A0AAV6V405_9ARAC|nr:hypothetical protein JTE90_016665 [Oedothorax gibbosus]